MSVSDGQNANASTFNTAFVSKTSDSTVTSKINLSSSDAASGDDITDAQLAINQLTFKTYANEAISAGGEISSTTLKGLQARRVSGSGAARTASTTPFGSTGGWVDGTVIRLIGTDNSNTLSITSTDSAKGAVLNGSSVTLKKDDSLDLQYDSSRDRWIEVSRNTTNTVLGGNLDVAGDITATGSITANGDITLGDADTDTIDVIGDLTIKSGNGIFIEDDSGDKITVTAPSAIDAPYTLTLPVNDGNADQVLTTDGSGSLSWGNSSGGGTGKNYITNSSCASSVITPWAAYADAAATTAVDGTGGSATVTITANTSSPLSDDADFLVTKDAANRQGEGVSCAFTIDNADKAKKMIISFDYTTSANYADDDIKIFIYDVTNTNLIRVNGEDLKAVSGTSKHYAQFQTASDSTSYRLILHCSSTNANAYTVNFDTVRVGPVEISHGTIVTDWKTFVPSWTNFTLGNGTNANFRWRRVGGSMEIEGRLIMGSTSAMGTAPYFTLPEGVSALFVDTQNDVYLGSTLNFETGTAGNLGRSYNETGNPTRVYLGTPSGSITSSAPFTWGDTDYIDISTISVPIVGWSSNAKMSEDFSGRDVVFSAYGDATYLASTPISLAHDSAQILDDCWVTTKDTTNSFSNDTGYFTTPETGYYDISGSFRLTYPDETDILRASVNIYIDGVAKFSAINGDMTGHGSSYQPKVNISGVYVEKGQTISLYGYQQNSTGSDAITLEDGNADTGMWFTVAKRPSAQTLLENETVAMKRWNSSNTQNFNFSSSSTIALANLFDVSDFDTHNAFTLNGTTDNVGSVTWAKNVSADIYTIPITGYYQVNAAIQVSDVELDCYLELYLRNVTAAKYEAQSQAVTLAGTSAGNYEDHVYLPISTIVHATKGDQLILGLHCTSGDSSADTDVDIPANLQQAEFSIAKIK